MSAENSNDLFGDAIDAAPEQIIEHLESGELKHKWGKSLAEIYEFIVAELQHNDYQADEARAAAAVVIRALARYGGGRTMYLPMGDALERALRDNQIWHEFNGSNIDELQRKYRVSSIHIYRILARMRKLRRRELQPELFDEPQEQQP